MTETYIGNEYKIRSNKKGELICPVCETKHMTYDDNWIYTCEKNHVFKHILETKWTRMENKKLLILQDL